jgi:DNA-binding NtrC family response regulator
VLAIKGEFMKQILLMLENDQENRDRVQKDLGKKFEIISVSTKLEMLNTLKINPVDFILVKREFLEDPLEESVVFEILQIDKRAIVIGFGEEVSTHEMLYLFRNGICDYVHYPFRIKELSSRFAALTKYEKSCAEGKKLKKQSQQILGVSPAIEKVKLSIINAGTMRTLFLGETGVGKSAFAKWSNHVLSMQTGRKRPFQHVNCANLKRERFVDELFGHVKGAYTGAISDKKGLVELAEGGDLFLDEIGDLDLECQGELLTFLDSCQYYKLGGTIKKSAKIRIISATNKDLKGMVANGNFRKDLYSRIAQAVIRLPFLRERREDIALFLKEFIRRYAGYNKNYDKQIENVYRNFPWSDGNVREFERACEYMCIQARNSDVIKLHHVDPIYTGKEMDYSFTYDVSEIYEQGYKKVIRDIEKSILEKTVSPTESVRKNAFKLGMDRASLGRKVAMYNIPIRFDHKTAVVNPI